MVAAPPRNTHEFILHCAFQRHPSCGSENTFSGPWCAVVWVVGAPPQNPNTSSGIVHFKDTHSNTQKHLLWPMVCSGMGGWGATPEPHDYFLAFCISKTPTIGIHSHFFWPRVRSGMGGWGATPEPQQFSMPFFISKPPILGIQKHLFWHMVCCGMGGWGATPEPYSIFWHCAV